MLPQVAWPVRTNSERRALVGRPEKGLGGAARRGLGRGLQGPPAKGPEEWRKGPHKGMGKEAGADNRGALHARIYKYTYVFV